MINTTLASSLYPVANALTSSSAFVDVFQPRDPTTNDVNYPIQKKWFNTDTGEFWILASFTTSVGVVSANWVRITFGSSVPFPWTLISSSQTLVINQGYFCVGGGALSLALPSVSNLGDTIWIALNGSTSFTITQGAGQQITVSGSVSTLGASGSVTSTGSGDSVQLVCQVANTIWVGVTFNGNLTVV